MSRRLALLMGALVLALLPLLAACGDSDDESAFGVETDAEGEVDYDFFIPAGTGELLAAGEVVELLPGELNVRVGEVIRIVNDDKIGHLIGPWFVGAGETVRQRFSSPGEFVGICQVHPSGEITVTVTEA